jgi:hypothetical protein
MSAAAHTSTTRRNWAVVAAIGMGALGIGLLFLAVWALIGKEAEPRQRNGMTRYLRIS